MSFYRCAHCGKIVSVVVDGGGTLGCWRAYEGFKG